MTKFLLVLKEFLKLKNEEMIDNRAYIIVSFIICTMILVQNSIVYDWFNVISANPTAPIIGAYILNILLLFLCGATMTFVFMMSVIAYSILKEFFGWIKWNWILAKSNVKDKLDEKK